MPVGRVRSVKSVLPRLIADESVGIYRAFVLSNVANASKRGQRLLADYAEREHFRADAVWSNVAGAMRPRN